MSSSSSSLAAELLSLATTLESIPNYQPAASEGAATKTTIMKNKGATVSGTFSPGAGGRSNNNDNTGVNVAGGGGRAAAPLRRKKLGSVELNSVLANFLHHDPTTSKSLTTTTTTTLATQRRTAAGQNVTPTTSRRAVNRSGVATATTPTSATTTLGSGKENTVGGGEGFGSTLQPLKNPNSLFFNNSRAAHQGDHVSGVTPLTPLDASDLVRKEPSPMVHKPGDTCTQRTPSSTTPTTTTSEEDVDEKERGEYPEDEVEHGDYDEEDEGEDEENGRRGADDGVNTVRYYKSLVSAKKYSMMTSTPWSDQHTSTSTNDEVQHQIPKLTFGGGVGENFHASKLHASGRVGSRGNSSEPVNSFSSPQHHQSIKSLVEFVPCKPCNPDQRKVSQIPMGNMPLNVIFPIGKTGFEEEKEFPIVEGDVIAGRYQVQHILGEAAFSRAVKCLDLQRPVLLAEGEEQLEEGEDPYEAVCVKVINSGKEFFDQALDEVKILHLLQTNGDTEEKHVVTLLDFFYFREHIFLVCELLSDNLYEYASYNREQITTTNAGEHDDEPDYSDFYFTLPRLQSIARQILTALDYVHSLDLVHCDLKPENIMFRSHSRCEIKVIDFGSSAFLTDRLSGYIQSRSYRAPEVILGAAYDGRIDIWSVGAIMVELITGDVLFHSDTVPEMLCRIVSILHTKMPFELLAEGRHSHAFIDRYGAIFELAPTEDGNDECMTYHFPCPTETIEERINAANDGMFAQTISAEQFANLVDFIQKCLTIDYRKRPTAAELLNEHPFLTTDLQEQEHLVESEGPDDNDDTLTASSIGCGTPVEH